MILLRWLLVLAVALLLAPTAQAQEKKDPPKPDAGKPEAAKPATAQPDPVVVRGALPPNWKQLGLTDEQKKKVYQVQGQFRVRIDDLERQIKELRAEERKELEKLLTDSQKTRLKEIAAGKVVGGGDDKPPEGAGKPPATGTKPPQ
jgi:TolA-binding protein